MEIRKIKHKDGKTEIHFEKPNGSGTEETVFKCEDAPRKGFLDALKALTNHMASICEMPDDMKGMMEATSVSISDVKGQRSVIISGRVRCDAGTYAVSTPLCVQYEENTGQGNLFPDTSAKVVNKLLRHAEKYIEGDRDAPVQEEEAAAAGSEG